MCKQILFLTLIAALLFSLFGCVTTQPQPTVGTQSSVTTTPTTLPTTLPTTFPTTAPTSLPTTFPTTQPTTVPTTVPTTLPTTLPTTFPTTLPTTEPPTVPTTTQPTQPTQPGEMLWVPICQEYITLRASPSGTRIGVVRVNETVTVKKWYWNYALIEHKGQLGYVQANFLKPADSSYIPSQLKAVTLTELYTYEQMQADIKELQQLYPSVVRVSSIGKSEQGRDIPVLQVGDLNAKYHVLMQGAIHAREYFTTCLIMAVLDRSLSQGIAADVCYHIIPMSNPDGVILSQSKTLDSLQLAIYQQDLAAGYTDYRPSTYAQQWKANALGVDLNRNFSSGWELSGIRPNPSCEKYRGSEPFSAAETRALRDYTLKYDFDATFSIHSSGDVIFYQFGSRQPVNRLSYSLAQAVQAVNGYDILSSGEDKTNGAGYKDWAMDELGIPSLTIEVGCNDAPLPNQEIYSAYLRFEGFMPAVNAWLRENAE